MGYRAMTALGVAALMLAGAPMYTRAESGSETPSATEKMEQKAEQLGGKAKSTAKEAKGDVTDAWVTAKAKIALFGDDRVKGRQISVETQEGTVILRGKVDSEEAKTAAADAQRTAAKQQAEVQAMAAKDAAEELAKTPERLFEPMLGGSDGRKLFESLLATLH